MLPKLCGSTRLPPRSQISVGWPSWTVEDQSTPSPSWGVTSPTELPFSSHRRVEKEGLNSGLARRITRKDKL